MFRFNNSLILFILFSTLAIQYYTFGSIFLWYVFAANLIGSLLLALGTYDHGYWAEKGVFSPPAYPFVGHIWSVVTFKEQGGMLFKRIYDKHKKRRFLGTHQFYTRTLVVNDPELIKRICVNDFQYFVDRGFFFNRDVDPLAESVLYLRGNEWKKLRAKISPIFSPNKLRGMYPLIENTADEFILKIKNRFNKPSTGNEVKVTNNNKTEKCITVESEKLVGGYTADAIVPCAFGVKSHVMDNDNDPFAVALHAFYEMSLYNIFEKTMRQFWPEFVLFFRMRIIPKKTHDFFTNIVTSVLRSREKGESEKRGDFIDMMMALRGDDEEKDDVQITDMIISANAFIIFLGGFETTSSTLSFMLLELAAHPEVQETMRREILDVLDKYGGEINYDALQDLTYMDMVINETLRLYPPFPTIQRLCTKDYVIPDTQITIEKGTIVLFPTLGIQRDDKYFENASRFVPERWAAKSPPPGVYMPFGDGPRYCIGKRFAQLQMKCCLVRILQHFRFSPAACTEMPAEPRAEPFAADPRSPLTLHPKDSKIRISLL